MTLTEKDGKNTLTHALHPARLRVMLWEEALISPHGGHCERRKRDVALFAWAALTKQWWRGDGPALSIRTPHSLGVWDCFPLKLVDKIASSFFFQPFHLIFLPCPEFLLSRRQTAVILDCDCSRNSSVSMPVAPGAEFDLGGQSQTWQY